MLTIDLTDDVLQDLYRWVDQIPLSRPKKNIARDFSDGERLFRRMGFAIDIDDVDAVVNSKRDAIERVLLLIRQKMGEYETRRQKRKSSLDSGANRSPGKMMDPDPVHRYEQMESAGQQSASPGPARSGDCISDEIAERDSRLACAKQMIEILTLKVEKLEQLMALKDGKIQALTMQLQQDDMGANYDDDDNSIK